MTKDFIQTIKEMHALIDEKNHKLLLKNKGIMSRELLSITTSDCLIEDAEAIINFKELNYPIRYIDAIIRNMCEQTIEYCYIMDNPNLLQDYFGDNIILSSNNGSKDMFDALHNTGSSRFTSGRKSVKAMARSIKEVKNTNKKIALYTIFSLKAEAEHNSYFQQILENVAEINNEAKLDDIDELYIITILNTFIDKYNNLA